MANSTSIILYPSDSRRQLLLAETEEQSLQVLRCPSGPGRTLDEIYTAAGLLVGKSANRAAHHLGLGPHAVARRICAFFGDGREREEKLEKLSTVSDDRKLKMDCVKLMGYALPSESSQTQLQAFKNIIMLTTRYRGIRRLFPPGWSEWDFMFHFAAVCLADQDISAMVEDSRARAVASIENDLSMVERLLVASDCEGVSKFSKHMAVRYLGGILELPSFWIQEGTIHEAVVKKIYCRTTGILQDLGIDSAEGEDGGVLADHDGIDILCEALLTGTRVWMMDKAAATDFTGKSWYNSLLEFIQLLRQPRSEDLLPKAWMISQDLRTIISTPYRLQEVDVLVDPKPCDPGPDTVPSFVPQTDNRRTGLQRAFQALSNYIGMHISAALSRDSTGMISSALDNVPRDMDIAHPGEEEDVDTTPIRPFTPSSSVSLVHESDDELSFISSSSVSSAHESDDVLRGLDTARSSSRVNEAQAPDDLLDQLQVPGPAALSRDSTGTISSALDSVPHQLDIAYPGDENDLDTTPIRPFTLSRNVRLAHEPDDGFATARSDFHVNEPQASDSRLDDWNVPGQIQDAPVSAVAHEVPLLHGIPQRSAKCAATLSGASESGRTDGAGRSRKKKSAPPARDASADGSNVDFMLPAPRAQLFGAHVRSSSAPTPPPYQVIQVPNVYLVAQSQDAHPQYQENSSSGLLAPPHGGLLPSLLPLISSVRRAAYPGPTHAAQGFDHMPSFGAGSSAFDFEANLQSSDFLRAMFPSAVSALAHPASSASGSPYTPASASFHPSGFELPHSSMAASDAFDAQQQQQQQRAFDSASPVDFNAHDFALEPAHGLDAMGLGPDQYASFAAAWAAGISAGDFDVARIDGAGLGAEGWGVGVGGEGKHAEFGGEVKGVGAHSRA
ncbi:hypothetical protein C8J57DRAFT_1669582 [Mycena rebaudengoi]|nr:hypothetical protein C8J57DRAFT_1669582 [Mycena rebaudengoi]